MLRQFSYVERLSGPVRALFVSRKLDSVDAATHLAMLSKRDQSLVARALTEGAFDTADLRAVVQLRQQRPTDSIVSLIRDVRESKTQRRYVAEFAIRESKTRQQIMRSLKRYISPPNIIDVRIEGALGQLVLTKAGKSQLFLAARRLNVPPQRIVSEILYGGHHG
jgi:hypothetical protein